MTFIENQICARLSAIADLPYGIGEVFNNTMCLISGIAGTTLAACCLGQSENLNETIRFLKPASWILPTLFSSSIKVLNPAADLFCDKFSYSFKKQLFSKALSSDIRPFYTPLIISESFIKKHLISRAVLTFYSSALIICKVVDLALGLIASVFAITTFGTLTSINKIALGQLKALDVITVPFQALFGFINPQNTGMLFGYYPYNRIEKY